MPVKKLPSVVAAFTEEQTAKLTGISVRQLRYWDRIDFFAPSLTSENRSDPYSRLYSFRDLVSLRVLHALRNESKVSLAHLRGVKEGLLHLGDDIWSVTTLYVLNRKVVFDNPATKQKEEVVSHQGVLGIPLKIVTGEMQDAVNRLKHRGDDIVGRVERHRNIAHNQAVIAGTRIPVSHIKAFAAEGYSSEDILKEYPTLTLEDVSAALKYEAA
jgi:uncharacterized protein (DUF433 family)